MSSDGTPTPLVPLETRVYLRNNQYCSLSMAVFTAYYWIATFHEEMETIWKGKVTGATVIFVLNRYVGLLNTALAVVRDIANMSNESCAVVVPTTNALTEVLYVIWAVFTTLRVFSLSKKSWVQALVCFSLSMAPPMMFLPQIHYSFGRTLGRGLGCVSTISDGPGIVLFSQRYTFSLAALRLFSVFAADGQLIYLTWVAVAPLGGIKSLRIFGKRSLLQVFLRNEILYFAIIIGFGIFSFGIAILEATNSEKNYTYLESFSGAISNILISQFLLELQAVDNRTRNAWSHLSSTNSLVSTVVFDRLIGSIGRTSLASGEGEDEVAGPDEVGSEELRTMTGAANHLEQR